MEDQAYLENLFINYETNKRSIIGKIFEKEIAESKDTKNKDDECSQYYTLDELMNTLGFDYYISKDGELKVEPQFPHVFSGCEDYVTVNADEIKTLYPSEFLMRLKK